MSERSFNDEHNLLPKAILIILGSWIFAYLLSVVFSQIGLVLIHVTMGRTGNIIFLNPFEFYTYIPNPLSEPNLWIIGSNFLNMICAPIVYFVIWKKQSHYLLPLRMWAPTVFMIEGIIIISQNIGFIYGNWTEIAGLGVIFAIFFLIIGFLMMYSVKLRIYDASKLSRGKMLLINLMTFPIWFIFYAWYFNFYPGAMLGMYASIIIALFNYIVEKPFLPFLSRKIRITTIPLKWSNAGFSLGSAIIIIMIFIFAPFEPYSEHAQIVNIYILIFFLIIGIIFFTMLISKNKKKKAAKKISVLAKDTRKIIPLKEKVEIVISEEFPVGEEIIEEEVAAPKEIPVVEEIIEEEIVAPKEIPVVEEVIEEEIVAPEEIPVEEEVVEEEVVAIEEIALEEQVIEETIIPVAPLVFENIVLSHTLRHAMGITSIAISPDNKSIASGSKDKLIKIWDLNTGKLLRTLRGHKKYINSVAISSDGKYIISGSNDKTVKIWNLDTGETIRTLTGHTFYVLFVAISPDGNYIVSSSYDKEIKVWDFTTGKLLNTIKGHKNEIGSVAISPDNKFIASASNDKTMKIWDLKSGELTITIRGYKKNVTSVAFSPNGKYIISGSNDKTISVWDISTGKLLRSLEGHTFYVSSVAISSNNNYVASGSFDKDVKVWDFSTSWLIIKESGGSIAPLTGN
ncbi:MAG: WD40 repeat domain-containing protein, partial [Candidatus Thorarchaeota archaeon]